MRQIHRADNLDVLRSLAEDSIHLVYIDPPFNTGKRQARSRLRTVRDEDGDRVGFKGRWYRTEKLGESGYDDVVDDYLGFLWPRLVEARRVLKPSGSSSFISTIEKHTIARWRSMSSSVDRVL